MVRLAVDIEQAVGRAAGQADVRFARLAGSVHHATDHGHVQGFEYIFKARFKRIDGLDDIELLARTRRAGDQIDAFIAQVQTAQDVETDLHLFDRIGGQRDADGIADTIGEQHAQTDGRLHCAAA